jgi:hypothetical protein
MKNEGKRNRLGLFCVMMTNMTEYPHICAVYDIPEKKIYLNRAADQTANVVQVRFSPEPIRTTRPYSLPLR